jgi:hypothetical protein
MNVQPAICYIILVLILVGAFTIGTWLDRRFGGGPMIDERRLMIPWLILGTIVVVGLFMWVGFWWTVDWILS